MADSYPTPATTQRVPSSSPTAQTGPEPYALRLHKSYKNKDEEIADLKRTLLATEWNVRYYQRKQEKEAHNARQTAKRVRGQWPADIQKAYNLLESDMTNALQDLEEIKKAAGITKEDGLEEDVLQRLYGAAQDEDYRSMPWFADLRYELNRLIGMCLGFLKKDMDDVPDVDEEVDMAALADTSNELFAEFDRQLHTLRTMHLAPYAQTYIVEGETRTPQNEWVCDQLAAPIKKLENMIAKLREYNDDAAVDPEDLDTEDMDIEGA